MDFEYIKITRHHCQLFYTYSPYIVILGNCFWKKILRMLFCFISIHKDFTYEHFHIFICKYYLSLMFYFWRHRRHVLLQAFHSHYELYGNRQYIVVLLKNSRKEQHGKPVPVYQTDVKKPLFFKKNLLLEN